MSTKTKTRRRIDWRTDWNRTALSLAGWGFSAHAISQHTGLSPSQVRYRLRQREIKLRDYRNGLSPQARKILARYT